MKLTCALLVALCVFAQSVAVNGDGHSDGHCEEWVGHGGCGHHCRWPHSKCCVEEKTVCDPHCKDPHGFCVHDPDFCVEQLVNKCEDHPKQVCSVKPVCEKVKKHVCKDVKDQKCYDKVEKVCKDVKDCKQVPVKKCDDVCDWKTECDHDKGGSVARASASARGSESASAYSSASASKDSAEAEADADAKGEPASAATNVFTRVGRRMNGCKKVKVCHPKCVTVHEHKCEVKRVCDDVKKTVCDPIIVKKCYDDWQDVCKNVQKCDVVGDKKCVLVKETVCKDKVTCDKYDCDEWQKCNPECCEDVKVAKCVKLY